MRCPVLLLVLRTPVNPFLGLCKGLDAAQGTFHASSCLVLRLAQAAVTLPMYTHRETEAQNAKSCDQEIACLPSKKKPQVGLKS